jgi:hypothetical protein
MPVAGAVVRFDRQDAAANSRHPRELANRRGDITDMLQDGGAERRIECTVAEQKVTRVRRGESGALIVCGRLAPRHHHALDDQVDANQANLGDVQLTDLDLGDSLATADVENPVAGAWLEHLGQELGEFLAPPSLAHVLEHRGGQGINPNVGHEIIRRGRSCPMLGDVSTVHVAKP